jgi:hypothetical protein
MSRRGGFKPGEFEEPGFGEEGDEMESQESGQSMERLLAAKEILEQQLLLSTTAQALSAESDTDAVGPKNIQGVGISYKRIDGRETNQLGVVVYVIEKVPEGEVASELLVPQEIKDIPTDVRAIGEIFALPVRGRYRAAPSGVSVGHYEITAGTLGCLVKRGRKLYILSNNHVLANSNEGKIGDPILQPGPYDGGRVPDDIIGKLEQFVPLQFNGPVNQVDCAIARTSPRLVSSLNKCMGVISNKVTPCKLDLLVNKCGRTTQFTKGRVTDCNATVRVNYGTSGIAVFKDQFVVESLTGSPFSMGGDSGSLIVSATGKNPAGLLYAGSSTHTIANPIDKVLSALNVTIVT